MLLSLKNRVLTELILIAAGTVVFLVAFPIRPTYVDIGLGLFALGLIVWNIRFTREKVWSQFPVEADVRLRTRRTLQWVALISVPTATLFLLLGILESRSEPGGVAERVLNWHMLVAFGIYFLWALVQQFLVQFYLLGRLLTILPVAPAVVLTGLTYSLVHLPEIGVTAVTAVAGIVWTGLYRRYRVLIPLAFSHAFLGTTFYYWVYGRDLFSTWSHGG